MNAQIVDLAGSIFVEPSTSGAVSYLTPKVEQGETLGGVSADPLKEEEETFGTTEVVQVHAKSTQEVNTKGTQESKKGKRKSPGRPPQQASPQFRVVTYTA